MQTHPRWTHESAAAIRLRKADHLNWLFCLNRFLEGIIPKSERTVSQASSGLRSPRQSFGLSAGLTEPVPRVREGGAPIGIGGIVENEHRLASSKFSPPAISAPDEWPILVVHKCIEDVHAGDLHDDSSHRGLTLLHDLAGREVGQDERA